MLAIISLANRNIDVGWVLFLNPTYIFNGDDITSLPGQLFWQAYPYPIPPIP